MAGPTRAPFFYLRSDEDVLARLHPEKEWALATFAAVALVATPLSAVGVAAMRLAPFAPPWGVAAVLAVYVGVLVVAGLVAWRRWATTEYALTDARVYARRGVWRTRVHFTSYDRITDLRYRQGPLEKLFGVSGLLFSTAGGDVLVRGVRDAIAVKETAETARDVFIQQLLERAGIEARERAAAAKAPLARDEEGVELWPSEPEPAAPPWSGPRPDYLKSGDVPLWHSKPEPIAAVSAVVPFLGILPFLLVGAMAGGGGIGLPVFLAVAAFVIGLRVVQLRRMEYTVTDKRVYTRSGVLGTTVTQLTYDKITDITYRQDLLGRLLGYGGVTVNTAGGNQAPATMMGLKKPLEVKAMIEAARARYLHEEEG